jgi:hypothetical protein
VLNTSFSSVAMLQMPTALHANTIIKNSTKSGSSVGLIYTLDLKAIFISKKSMK